MKKRRLYWFKTADNSFLAIHKKAAEKYCNSLNTELLDISKYSRWYEDKKLLKRGVGIYSIKG